MASERRQAGDHRGEVHFDLGLGELFKGIGNLVDLVSEMSQQGQTEIHRTGEITGLGKAKGIYGFSIRTGIGGAPTVEQFGNIRRTSEGPIIEETREPIVDVFDEGDRVLAVAELPGVSEATIRCQAEGDVLTLAAEGKDRKYAKELLLPSAVEKEPLRQAYQNGILEVEFKKAAE